MKTILIDLPDNTYEKLDKAAAREGRSLDNRVINILEDWVWGAIRNTPPLTEEQYAELARASKPRRQHMKANVRERIFIRDKGICQQCKGLMPFEGEWHIDHVIPVVKGGSNSEQNLQLLCPPCNIEKRDKLL